MQISSMVRMNVYQKAKRQKRGPNIKITGGRPVGGIDEFMPTGWTLHEPQQTVMDRIHDVLSLIRVRR